MNKYKMYYLHDPIGNIESAITNFDRDYLQKALDDGLIIIGVTQNDEREIIYSVDDVMAPKTAIMEGFTLVLPSYVDSKIDELAAVVEELTESLSSQISAKALLSIRQSIDRIHEETEKTAEKEVAMLSAMKQ